MLSVLLLQLLLLVMLPMLWMKMVMLTAPHQ